MKHMKKLIVAALAVMTAVALCVPALAFAAGTGSINITPPDNATATHTYTIYKVFDADGNGEAISYKLMSGKSAPLTATDGLSKFDVDASGNVHYYTRATTADDWAVNETATDLSEQMIAAIAAYVDGDDPVATANSTGTATATASNLANGYYYITTSTGTAVAINSTNPNADIKDKNIVSTVVKSAGTEYDADSLKAIAAVGTSQSFTAVITKNKGATNLVFTDVMTNMTYNEDLTVEPAGAVYTVTPTGTGFEVEFDNDYISGLADGTTITLSYSGTIASEALSANPATNKATLTSGDGNESTSETVEVYNAKFTVKKIFSDNPADLPTAGFVLKNSDGKYYKLANNNITWVDDIDSADVHESNASGDVTPFMGLGVGNYVLVEKVVPSGYNKAADYSFEIVDGNFTAENLEQEATVENKTGSVLPSTGGMGTTILYIVGGIMIVVAAVFLVGRRRASKDKDSEDQM